MTQASFEERLEMTGADRGPGRPKSYHTADGKRVPSVTTITARFKESGGLLHWANTQGREGRTMEEARKGATDVGSIVHAMVEARLHGQRAAKIPPEFRDRVLSAYSAWEQWMENSRFEIVSTEQPIVSEAHHFGGTLDCVMRDSRGRLALGDWKSSKKIYTDYLVQVAAYAALWNETQEEKITGGFHIVRFSKDEGDMEHRYFPNLDDGFAMFLHLRAAYDLDKKLKERVK